MPTTITDGPAGSQIVTGDDILFHGKAGSGTVTGGNGANIVVIGPKATGDWTISVGDGKNVIVDLAAGKSTITTGKGVNTIAISGAATITMNGSENIFAHVDVSTAAKLMFVEAEIGPGVLGTGGFNSSMFPAPPAPTAETFSITAGLPRAITITDFNPTIDKLDFAGYGPTPVVKADPTPAAGVMLTLADASTVTLNGVAALPPTAEIIR